MSTFLKDLRYAFRSLSQRPGVTIVAIIALGLAIGASSAMFSVVNAVILKPLNFDDSNNVVIVWESAPKLHFNIFSVSPANFADWRKQAQSFETMAAYQRSQFTLTGMDAAERVPGALVSADYFKLVRTAALIGRTLLPDLQDYIIGDLRESLYILMGAVGFVLLIACAISQARFNATLLAAFAGVALLLASVGVYGVMAYSVNQRIHEIGIRMALGQRRSSVLKMVLGQALLLTGIGVVIGIVGAVALTRVMLSMLFHVDATDPITFLSVAAILVAVAAAASYLPARRATRVDPMIALRYE